MDYNELNNMNNNLIGVKRKMEINENNEPPKKKQKKDSKK